MRPLALGRTPVAMVRDAEVLVDAIAALTGLKPGAVRNRTTRVHGQRHVRSVFADRWPARLDELGAEPAGELLNDEKLVSELARLLGHEREAVAAGLRAQPKLLVSAVFRDLWPEEDCSAKAILELTVQQARGRGDAAGLARAIGIDPGRFARRLRSSHGAMLVRNAIADLLAGLAAPPIEGLLFGRYELEGRRWEGGFGVVREGWDRSASPNRRVVLKWPKTGAKAVAALEGEFERACDLRHPGLVGYLALHNEPDGSPVVVIEHGGVALRERLSDRAMPPVEAIRITRRLAEALDYLGERNLAHLDLHPGNILIDASGEPRVTDFGIARRLVGAPGSTGVSSIVPGFYRGFAAPEVERGKSASRRSDQFSLALVFLSCVCGGEDAAMDCVNDGNLPLNRRQVAAFQRARSESPAKRFPSCGEFVDALAKPGLFARLWR